jgi:hypothetical protein
MERMGKEVMNLLSKLGLKQRALTMLFFIIMYGGVVITMDSSAMAAGKVIMVLEPSKLTYAKGTIPDFNVIIRNNSDKPVKICIYMIEYRLRLALSAKGLTPGAFGYIYQPFEPMNWDAPVSKEFTTLSPGRQLNFLLDISQDVYFGFVQKHSQPSVIPNSHAIKGFPAGTYEFSTCIQDRMAIYKGKSGVYDNTLEKKQLSTLPGSEGTYFDLVEAKTKVTFK